MNRTPPDRSERRRFPRRPLATRIDLSEPHDAAFFSGRTRNVSQEGVAVRTRETVPEVGSRLDFGFRTQPDRPPVRGTLEIVWVRPFQGPDGDHEFGARVMRWHGHDRADADPRDLGEDDDTTHPAVRSSSSVQTDAGAAVVGSPVGRSSADGTRLDRDPRPGTTGTPRPRHHDRRAVAWTVVAVLVATLATMLGLSAVAGRRSHGATDGIRSGTAGAMDPAVVSTSGEVVVDSMAVRRTADTTVVELGLDRSLDPSAVSAVRLEDPPRVVVRLVGVRHGPPRASLPTVDPVLLAVRTRSEPDLVPCELHVVLDLRHEAVELRRVAVEADSVSLSLTSD